MIIVNGKNRLLPKRKSHSQPNQTMNPIHELDQLEMYFKTTTGQCRQVPRYQTVADDLVTQGDLNDALRVRLQRHIRTFHFECNPGTTTMIAGYKKRVKEFSIHLQKNEDKYNFNERARSFNDRRANTNTEDEHEHLPPGHSHDSALVRIAVLELKNRELTEQLRNRPGLTADAHATIETATQEKLMSDYKLQEMQKSLDAERVASSQLREVQSEYYEFVWMYEQMHIHNNLRLGDLMDMTERCLRLLGRMPPRVPPPQTGDAEPSAKRTRTEL